MVAPPNPWTPVPARIARRRRETNDTFTVDIEPPDAGAFPFAPGQFNMLYVFGVGEVAISISGDPDQPQRLVHTIRAVGTVTKAMRKLPRGAAVGLRGPYGRGWPVGQAHGADLLVIAGGLGLAPLRPVIYDALRHRARFGRVTVLYGARRPADLLYRSELVRWARSLDVQVTVDRATPEWRGRVGVVPALIDRRTIDPSRTVAMICGPEIMMRFVVRALAACGVPWDRMFVSLERNMKCAIGFCGHCQLAPAFICKDGPVMSFDRVAPFLKHREL